MKYFIDTEFVEGFYKPLFGKKRHFIDLISIAIVAEDGREYYAISNEFDLDYIWDNKDTWVKDNVLSQIHTDMCRNETPFAKTYFSGLFFPFTKKSIKRLLKWQGKSNNTIAQEIKRFIWHNIESKQPRNEFYAYYADYDWVALCSLFGTMIHLPKYFPMYCKDIKQIMDDNNLTYDWKDSNCPEPIGEHNALIDARWNKQLYEKIKMTLSEK